MNHDIDIDYKKVFEHVTVAMSIAEPHFPNRLLYVNKAFCDLTGYSPSEVIGINPGELLQKPPYSKVREQIRSKINNYEDSVSLVLNYRKDGSAFWNELHLHPVMEEGECIYWVGTPVDVSEQVNKAAYELEQAIQNLKDHVAQVKNDTLERLEIRKTRGASA